MTSFVDDYEFGARVVRAAATTQGRPDPSALCAMFPDVTENIGASLRPVLLEAAERLEGAWKALPWTFRARCWIYSKVVRGRWWRGCRVL